MYDGVEEHIDENKKPLDSSVQTRDRSVTQELESLTKPIKPEDVEEVILTGTVLLSILIFQVHFTNCKRFSIVCTLL